MKKFGTSKSAATQKLGNSKMEDLLGVGQLNTWGICLMWGNSRNEATKKIGQLKKVYFAGSLDVTTDGGGSGR